MVLEGFSPPCWRRDRDLLAQAPQHQAWGPCCPHCRPRGPHQDKLMGSKARVCDWESDTERPQRTGKCALFSPTLTFDSHILPASVTKAQDDVCSSCTPCCELANNLFWILFNPKNLAQVFILLCREAFLHYNSSELTLVQINIM